MGRVATPVTRTKISSADFGIAMRNDYVSQTETGYTQTIPSPKSVSYIILKSGSDYYAINGLTNVCDYGGAGDAGGVDGADASAVINAAVSALTNGGIVFLKQATYVINAAIVIDYDYTQIWGENWNTILQADTSMDDHIINVTSKDYFVLRNIQIDHDHANQTEDASPVSPLDKCGVFLSESKHGKILNCYIHGSPHLCVYMRATTKEDQYHQVIGCLLGDTRTTPTAGSNCNVIGFTKSNRGLIRDCEVYDGGDMGIEVWESDYTEIINCVSRDTTVGYGIEITGGGTTHCDYTTVIGGLYEGNNKSGVRISGTNVLYTKCIGVTSVNNSGSNQCKGFEVAVNANFAEINGCVSHGNDDMGILIATEGCRVIGGEVYNHTTNTKRAVYVEGNKCVVDGTVIHDNTGGSGVYVVGDNCLVGNVQSYNNAYGIYVHANADKTRIDDCQLETNTTSNLTDGGTKTRINGLGREACGGGAPTAADWNFGDVVQDTDNPANHWVKDYDGTFRRIA